ncbi:hypothetical protein FACS189440_16600 [Bacteroidia bacterium]|nr:hypothetical protein FACS189440_16600 [Bacteroidia bacterium]
MALIREIIEKEQADNQVIHLYKEGIFLKGYEFSAYLFINHIKPSYQVKTTYFKGISQWICSIGFPESALNTITAGKQVITTDGGVDIFPDNAVIDTVSYDQWKEGHRKQQVMGEQVVASSDRPPVFSDSQLWKRVVSFDLANKTPMQCVAFISEIQQELNEKLQCVR